jgi:hypothetical protein
VLARFMTAGHEPSTPNDTLVAQIAGDEHKIIFMNSIPGKHRNLSDETIKHEALRGRWCNTQGCEQRNVLPCHPMIATV